MSGISEWPLTAKAVLHCDNRRCDARWESGPYDTRDYRSKVQAAAPALEAGWTVYTGSRTQHTYCPHHGPKTPMRLIHGTDDNSRTAPRG